MTRCGRVLRKLSLDELPQHYNVLRGEMTLVGPRPTSFGAETYHLWQTARLEVKPGVTGLWQVNGRADLDFDERLRLDIVYIRHRCLQLDLLILVRTVGAVLSRKGAH
jgi:lipopolysaccharide/colanic/teichoic acid biosynthesis glycosyltransferase